MILLDVGLPAASWLGIIITALLGLLYFLLKNAYKAVEDELEDHKEEIKQLRKDLTDLSIRFWQDKNSKT